jgi:hypothetical protein
VADPPHRPRPVGCTSSATSGERRTVLAPGGCAAQPVPTSWSSPELALVGYPPDDLLLRPSSSPWPSGTGTARARQARPGHGRARRHRRSADARRRRRRGASLRRARPHEPCGGPAGRAVDGTYDKMRLPNEGVFDEARYFVPGTRPLVTTSPAFRSARHLPGPLDRGRSGARERRGRRPRRRRAQRLALPPGQARRARGLGHTSRARARRLDLLREPRRRPGRGRVRRGLHGRRPVGRHRRARRAVREDLVARRPRSTSTTVRARDVGLDARARRPDRARLDRRRPRRSCGRRSCWRRATTAAGTASARRSSASAVVSTRP